MFRTTGSIFARGFAATIVSLTLTLAVTGCSSDSSTTTPDSGSTPSTCDLTGAEAVFTASCTSSTCHNSTDKQSGLDLSAGSDLGTRLLGVMPKSTASISCGNNTTPYLTASSNPATGLLISKISSSSPPCGVRMPFGLGALSAAQISCITTWATTVTSP